MSLSPRNFSSAGTTKSGCSPIHPKASAASCRALTSGSSSIFTKVGTAGSAGLPIMPNATAARYLSCGSELVSISIRGGTLAAPMAAKDHAAISPSLKNGAGSDPLAAPTLGGKRGMPSGERFELQAAKLATTSLSFQKLTAVPLGLLFVNGSLASLISSGMADLPSGPNA